MVQPASRAFGTGIETNDVENTGMVDADGLPWLVYICNACGLLYHEREGDVDGGLAPGTRFADIPDDWACPLCGVRKDDFVLYEAADGATLRRAATQADGDPGRALATRAPSGVPSAPTGRNRTLPRGVVIVGAGHAGWRVAQEIRRRDANVPIKLVTGCNGDLYDKPMLSVAYAKGIAPDQLVRERGVDAAARLQLHLMPDTFATGLSTQAHQLRTTRGTLHYGNLIIAQGARARALDVLPASLCWRINHLDAYLRLRQHLASVGSAARDVVIVGAGLVGCELANDLALAGHRITLLDVGDAPLAPWLPAPAAAMLLRAWESLPIKFIGHAAVTGLTTEGAQRVLTTDTVTIAAHEVISAAGLEVDRLLADSGGLEWNRGIAVDAPTLATSAPNIFALGDCITIAGVASRYLEPIGRQAQAIAGVITGIDPAPYRAEASPVRVKTSTCSVQLEGVPDVDGTWRIDIDTRAPQGAGGRLHMSQWVGNMLHARLQVGQA